MTINQTAVLARVIWRLTTGRDGEQIVADARDYPIVDPPAVAGTAAKAALCAIAVVVALAIVGTAIEPDDKLSAGLHDAQPLQDL